MSPSNSEFEASVATDSNDNIRGTEGDDSLFGGLGTDTIRGLGGNDSIYGGRETSDPTFDPDDSADEIFGGAGSDLIFGNAGDDTIYGGGETSNPSFDPEDNADEITGGRGNDLIFGNGGDDLIIGDGNESIGGDDTIAGGFGDDTIDGGVGNDTYIFFDPAPPNNNANDRIIDSDGIGSIVIADVPLVGVATDVAPGVWTLNNYLLRDVGDNNIEIRQILSGTPEEPVLDQNNSITIENFVAGQTKLGITLGSIDCEDLAGNTLQDARDLGTLNDEGLTIQDCIGENPGFDFDRSDFYKFELEEGSAVNFQLDKENSADTFLQFYDSNGSVLDSVRSTSDEDIQNITRNFLPGTYFVQIINRSTSQGGTAYTLTINTPSASSSLVVTNLNESGAGSLRQAIINANADPDPDEITFDSGLSGTIALTSGELQITNPLIISGLGAEQITIDGQNNSRVFNLDDGDVNNQIDVTLTGLTITGGNTSGDGGGIFNNESLELRNSNINFNTAARGGGLFVNGTANIIDSRITDNLANNIDGAGGIQDNSNTTTLTGSIVVRNSGNRDLGGSGSFISGGNNIIGNGEDITDESGNQVFINGVNGDLAGTTENPVEECFLTGTRILTEEGYKKVETLTIGDRVKTKDGKLEPIKWIGYQSRHPNQIRNPLRGYPILIKAGALGENVPIRDLYVSPDHALLVDELLINAGALVNNVSIIKTTPTEPFCYWHVELKNHSLLIAEGTAAESFYPNHEDRLIYDNGAEYERLYPYGNSQLMLFPLDYPRVSSQNKVPRYVRSRLMQIATKGKERELELL